MTFAIHGLAVSRGIAIGRAVVVASSRMEVVHYFIRPDQVETEIARARSARNAVIEELRAQGLTDGGWDFLEPHAYAVMRRIRNPEIAALHIMEV